MELQKCVWEEKGEKIEEHWRAGDKETKQSQTENQPQREAKKVDVVNWWKALSVEKVKTRTKEVSSGQELSQTQAKLSLAEQTITDMREQVCHLQASLRSAQEHANEQKHCSPILCVEKATNTEKEEQTLGKSCKDQRDVAVTTDPVEITGVPTSHQEQNKLQVTADRLLVTLRKMETMVNSALDTAERVKESEHRVRQVRMRMESITQKVEEALGRSANTERQLGHLETKITAQV